MGSGIWSASTYSSRVEKRRAAGKDVFEYSAAAKSSGNLRVHQTLDPYGLQVRESRDSAEHPASNSIIIALDETGSMNRVIRGIHGDLPQLFHLLLGRKYIPHPQILFAGFGDAVSDQVPLQVGQFESDNRMDENLENIILEGNGGPYGMESYELMMFVAARHTAIDCFEKRGRKGYLFMIGDEMAYPGVKSAEVQQLLGYSPQTNIPLAQIIAEVQEKYHFYFIIPAGASGGKDPKILTYWQDLLGAQYVIRLENPDDVSETIGLAIGLNEGTIGLDDGAQHLAELGANSEAIEQIKSALSVLPSPSISSGNLSNLNPPRDDEDRTRRL